MLPAALPAAPPLTTIAEFWTLTDAEKAKPQEVRMEVIVYYYDAAWKIFYGEVAGVGSFLPVQGSPLPLKSGQRVRLEGTVVPAAGFDGERVKVTVLDEGLLPEPLRTAGRIDDFAALHGRWTEIEGYVLAQHEPDTTHIEMKFLSDNRLIDLTLQIEGTDPVPQLKGARIRVLGVYDAVADATGRPEQIQCWTSRNVQVLGWLADEERFKLPVTPIDRLETVAGQSWVHLTGELWSQEAGRSVTLRDATGQLTIGSPQPESWPAKTAIEVVGHPVRQEFGWTLENALFRAAQGPRDVHVPGQAPLHLRLAAQLARLTLEEADLGQTVTLRGVVTWFDPRASYFYLQDVSGGVRVHREPGAADGVAAGASIALRGVTMRGDFAAEVALREVTPIGPLGLPPPRSTTLDQALAGTEECRRVEMRGYVREVRRTERATRLELTTAMGEFTAVLPSDQSLDYLTGSIARLRGVCTVVPDAKHEIAGIELWVQDRDAVTVDEPPLRDPSMLPLLTTAGLGRFVAARVPDQWVRVVGVVQLSEAGRSWCLQDAEGGLLVMRRGAAVVRPGTTVEVVGLPGRVGNRLALREAVWQIVPAAGSAIRPRQVFPGKLLDPAADLQLVQMEASLRQVVREGRRLRLSLEAGDQIFEGSMPAPADWTPPHPGSRLQLTGVYLLEFDDYRQPRGLRLELRSPADVVLLTAPAWWTIERTIYAAAVLAAAVALALAWVVALKRRVRRQTELIRVQMEKETRMQSEVERAARLESLGVLAGGIAHDFNNLLTAILGNLGLASMDKRVMTAAGDCISEAERGARRARDITHQLLTFAKGGEPVRTAVSLPEIVTEAANFARHGSNVRLDISCPPDLPAGDVDAGQVSRVIHNLVLNAVQVMPDSGVVGLSLDAVDVRAGEIPPLAPGRYIRLVVSDTGPGIAPEVLPRIFDPYFSTKTNSKNSGLGLATVHSIIQRHHGHIEVTSQLGKGTTFRLWLPTAKDEPPAAAAFRGSVFSPGRVLVMDDEAVVRRVAGRMLALAGHETVFAADGAEAVQAYATARQTGRSFDFVIFDLTVPGGMGGKDALAELLKVDPNIRAIASSGYSNDPIMAHPSAYGFRARLPKPYDIPDLMRAIEEARRD